MILEAFSTSTPSIRSHHTWDTGPMRTSTTLCFLSCYHTGRGGGRRLREATDYLASTCENTKACRYRMEFIDYRTRRSNLEGYSSWEISKYQFLPPPFQDSPWWCLSGKVRKATGQPPRNCIRGHALLSEPSSEYLTFPLIYADTMQINFPSRLPWVAQCRRFYNRRPSDR